MIVPFDTSHLEELNSWLKLREIQPISPEELPSKGFLVPGVAAAFIRKCEGNVAIMDSLVSNPQICPVMRHKAMDDLYKVIISECRDLGIKRILGFTSAIDTLNRSLTHGFVQAPYHVLVRQEQ